jgi:uncharacterized phiE125 gp8 family phage protein
MEKMNYILTEPEITTPVTTEPVELQEAKDWMKITFDEEDTIITDLIPATRELLERYTSRSLAPKTLTVLMEINDCSLFELPYGPVTGVTTVTRKNEFDDDETMVAGEDYQVVGKMIRIQTPGTYEIEYEAGYDPLPDDLRKDQLRLIGWMYQNRGIQFEAADKLKSYPDWQALAANRYVNSVV